ncbi:hypothetical protein RUND412_008860 [Rhizina undulata]
MDPRPAESSRSGENLSSVAEHKDPQTNNEEAAIGALTFEANDFAFARDDKVLSKASTGRLNFTNVSNEKLHEKPGESTPGGYHSQVPTSEIKAGGSIYTPANTPGKTSTFFLRDSYLQDWESIKRALPEIEFEHDANPQHPPITPRRNTAQLEPENIKLVHPSRRCRNQLHRQLHASNLTGSPTPVRQSAKANLNDTPSKTTEECESPSLDNTARSSPSSEGPQTPGKKNTGRLGAQSPRLHKLVRSPACWDLTRHLVKAAKTSKPRSDSGISKPLKKHFFARRGAPKAFSVAELREKFEK